MRFALTVAVIMLLSIAVSTAMAEPYVSVWQDDVNSFNGTSSWFGNVGLIATPTAQTPPASGAALQYHRIRRASEDINVFGATFGVTKMIEAGATRIDLVGGGDETVGNVKVRLDAAKWLDNPSFPAVAIGAVDITDQINRSLYLVMSTNYQLGGGVPAVNLHLGYANASSGGTATNLDGIFGGLDFQALRYGTIQAEYDGNDFNAALRYNVKGKFTLDLGALGGDFGYGVTYHSQF